MKTFRLSLMLASMAILISCATQPSGEPLDAPGFFRGYLHGLVILFSLIWHLFDSSVRIYAFPNSGGWYDFGFVLGAASSLGSASSAAARRREDRERVGPR